MYQRRSKFKDGSSSKVRLVDGGCISFENRRSGKICRATKEQEISAQTWRIPREKMNINVLQDGVEENVEYTLRKSVQS